MKVTSFKVPGCPVAIGLLADLHAAPLAPQALQEIRGVDMIAVAGDIMYGSRPEDDVSPLLSQSTVLPTLRRLVSIAPTFLSLGNHERCLDPADLDLIREVGVVVLDNSFTTIQVGENEALIGGLTSAYVTEYRREVQEYRVKHRNGLRYPEVHHYRSRAVEEKRARKPELDWIPAFVAEEGYHILLSHHPEYYPLIPEGVDLCLSGHAHGGQWNIYNPFEKREDGGRGRWRGVFAPGQGLWPRYTSGVYMEPGLGRLIVSRGLANTAGVPRIFNPCEVVVVEGD